MVPFKVEDIKQKHINKIREMCRKFTIDYDFLLCDSLEKISRFKDKFTGTEADFYAWSFTIVRNNHINIQKAKRRHNLVDIEFASGKSNTVGVDRSIAAKDYIKLVDSYIIKTFNPKHVSIFRMYFYDQLSDEEISKKLNIPEVSVRVIIHKMRKHLHEVFRNKKQNRIHILH